MSALPDGEAEVRRAFRELLRRERGLRARKSEVGWARYRVLSALEDAGEDLPAGRLAAAAELRPASMTQALDHLEQEGLVTRERSAEDRRVVVVSLSEAGRAWTRAKRAIFDPAWRDALDGLSDDELAAGAEVLRRLTGLMDVLVSAGSVQDGPSGHLMRTAR